MRIPYRLRDVSSVHLDSLTNVHQARRNNKQGNAMSKTFIEHVETRGAVGMAPLLGVSANYLFKVKSGARPLTDELLAHAWRRLGKSLDVEGSIRQRSGCRTLEDEVVEAQVAHVVILAHRYAVEAGEPVACQLSTTLLDVVRDMAGVQNGQG
jgi:hypothetical protein